MNLPKFVTIFFIMIGFVVPRLTPDPVPEVLPKDVFKLDPGRIEVYRTANKMCFYYRDSNVAQGCWEISGEGVK